MTTSVSALQTDPTRLDKILKAIERANKKLPKGVSPGKLVERDTYLHAETRVPRDWLEGDPDLQAARLEHVVSVTRKLSQHAAISAIAAEHGR